ncbi:Ira1p [Sugiyamaella lignohabitans]|uniref:Ira1p n=1 Tax=Sugiyamaella lignohabitans TaxID=796027 RepID=A0A167D7A0_9ASCO|nr:Ira1p [Sugiyamaella lignohabitans]ANB12569.1 Ira1p [Sugiyamaella lignohabitans]
MEDTVPFKRNTSGATANRQSKRYSVAALYMSMGGVDRDDDIDDELAKAQKYLRQLKSDISEQSKRNFLLEKDVRYLDGRIALLIQNKMNAEEQKDIASRLEEAPEQVADEYFPDRKKTELYGNLFFLLQSEPKHIALLCRVVSMAEIDSLLQTVMFTIYGNQYEQREEHLLLTMFQAVLAYQFDNAQEFSSLLRANTPVSRMMTTYTRRGPGQSYLRSALSAKLSSIIDEKNLNLEINPLKVYEELVDMDGGSSRNSNEEQPTITAEEASRHPMVLEMIRPRHVKLKQLSSELLDTILSSLDMVPYGIRWICKQIRLLTKRKYPTATDAAVCSLIGAFFFLRFINPAIVTPQAYMLVDRLPSDNSRRVLTLLAKMLQNLVNKPTYSKEPYMQNLAPFVDANKARINNFLQELCDVPDFNESLEMDQYVALSKKDLFLNITLNEVYGMHSLLDKYHEKVIQNESSHLGLLLADIGESPGLVPRSANANMELQLFNRWETEVGDVDGGPLDFLRADVIFMEAKSLMINIIRAFPPGHNVLQRPLDLHKIADFAATTNEEALVKRGIKALDLLVEIEQADSDDAELLQAEVDSELKQLGSLQESVENEAKSLDDVYRIIRDHNEYLRSQIDTYKSYLANVRMQTGGPLGAVTNGGGKPTTKSKIPVKKYTPPQLIKENVVLDWRLPDSRTANMTLYIASPVPGTFVISLVLKGRAEPIFTLDLKLDDLLEMSADKGLETLDLECIVFSIKPLVALLKRDLKRK